MIPIQSKWIGAAQEISTVVEYAIADPYYSRSRNGLRPTASIPSASRA